MGKWGSIGMSRYNVGDRVKIELITPYTEEEIRVWGCHPDVDGKTGTVNYVDQRHGWEHPSYHIDLDEPLLAHILHENTEFEGNTIFEYIEEEKSLNFLELVR